MQEDLIEPVPVPDIFVAGLGKIEPLGFVTRLLFYVPEGSNKVVAARLIIPDTGLALIKRYLAGGRH